VDSVADQCARLSCAWTRQDGNVTIHMDRCAALVGVQGPVRLCGSHCWPDRAEEVVHQLSINGGLSNAYLLSDRRRGHSAQEGGSECGSGCNEFKAEYRGIDLISLDRTVPQRSIHIERRAGEESEGPLIIIVNISACTAPGMSELMRD